MSCFEDAFQVSSDISARAQYAELHRAQLELLAASVSLLVNTLDRKCRDGYLLDRTVSVALENLNNLLEDLSRFFQYQSTDGFIKSLIMKDERIAQIEDYYHRIETSFSLFEEYIQHRQSRNEKARRTDESALHSRLDSFEANLAEMLKPYHHNVKAIMVAFQRKIQEGSGGGRELQFFKRCIRYLSTTMGVSQMPLESWMITSFEVEFEPEIDPSRVRTVFEGYWKKIPVMLKFLRAEYGAAPNFEILHELRHPHVLEIIGANRFDNKPFIVMPYLRNGNVRVYIRNYPNCDRLKIMLDVSRGLEYLHSKDIVHGNLKGSNIMINDTGDAVICDVGLASVRADINGATNTADVIIGGRNWAAPERFSGREVEKPCDIYSFGMITYEVYTDETPLDHVNQDDFLGSVSIRPERPNDEEAPKLTDEIWELAEQCWVKDPFNRPSIKSICVILQKFHENSSQNSRPSRSPGISSVGGPEPGRVVDPQQPPNALLMVAPQLVQRGTRSPSAVPDLDHAIASLALAIQGAMTALYDLYAALTIKEKASESLLVQLKKRREVFRKNWEDYILFLQRCRGFADDYIALCKYSSMHPDIIPLMPLKELLATSKTLFRDVQEMQRKHDKDFTELRQYQRRLISTFCRSSTVPVARPSRTDKTRANTVDSTLSRFVQAAEASLRPDCVRSTRSSEKALNAVLLSLTDLTAFWWGQMDHLSGILSSPDVLPKREELGELEQRWGRYRSAIQIGISSISASSDAARVDAVGPSQTPSRQGVKSGWALGFFQSFLNIFRRR